jgi:hypothetical protein
MAIATGMSVDEMNNILKEIGVETETTIVTVPQTTMTPRYRITMEREGDFDPNDPYSGSWIMNKEELEPVPSTGYIEVP